MFLLLPQRRNCQHNPPAPGEQGMAQYSPQCVNPAGSGGFGGDSAPRSCSGRAAGTALQGNTTIPANPEAFVHPRTLLFHGISRKRLRPRVSSSRGAGPGLLLGAPRSCQDLSKGTAEVTWHSQQSHFASCPAICLIFVTFLSKELQPELK